jgi:hypothetical protein
MVVEILDISVGVEPLVGGVDVEVAEVLAGKAEPAEDRRDEVTVVLMAEGDKEILRVVWHHPNSSMSTMLACSLMAAVMSEALTLGRFPPSQMRAAWFASLRASPSISGTEAMTT